jgi:hypothetical protein
VNAIDAEVPDAEARIAEARLPEAERDQIAVAHCRYPATY